MPAHRKVDDQKRARILDCHNRRREVHGRYGVPTNAELRRAKAAELAEIPSPRQLAGEMGLSVFTVYNVQEREG